MHLYTYSIWIDYKVFLNIAALSMKKNRQPYFLLLFTLAKLCGGKLKEKKDWESWKEVTIIDVLADEGTGVEAYTNDSRKACPSFLLLFHGLQDTLVLSCPILHTLSSEDLVTFLLIQRNFSTSISISKERNLSGKHSRHLLLLRKISKKGCI